LKRSEFLADVFLAALFRERDLFAAFFQPGRAILVDLVDAVRAGYPFPVAR
jgi:hypothetical protein